MKRSSLGAEEIMSFEEPHKILSSTVHKLKSEAYDRLGKERAKWENRNKKDWGFSRSWAIFLMAGIFPIVIGGPDMGWMLQALVFVIWLVALAQMWRFMNEAGRLGNAARLIEILAEQEKQKTENAEPESPSHSGAD